MLLAKISHVIYFGQSQLLLAKQIKIELQVERLKCKWFHLAISWILPTLTIIIKLYLNDWRSYLLYKKILRNFEYLVGDVKPAIH